LPELDQANAALDAVAECISRTPANLREHAGVAGDVIREIRLSEDATIGPICSAMLRPLPALASPRSSDTAAPVMMLSTLDPVGLGDVEPAITSRARITTMRSRPGRRGGCCG